MKIQDLAKSKNLIIQILWGEKSFEFFTSVIDCDATGIYVKPYLHGGAPLKLNINMQNGVACNLFGDNPAGGRRVTWKNINLSTVYRGGETLYHLSTTANNSQAKNEERRAGSRIRVDKLANLYDFAGQKSINVRIHDLSDSGIAVLTPANDLPKSNMFLISFSDEIHDQQFELHIKCKAVRNKEIPGAMLYGCEITEESRDYLLYGCLLRMMKNAES